ncbi:hypothetical protein ACLMJK_007739 [Lecanora helva]
MTDRWIVFVSSREQLQKLQHESDSVLSSEDALHELAFTDSILGRHQVPPEHKGPQSEAFRVTVGVTKNNLRSNVSAMSGAFQKRITEAVALEIAPRDVHEQGRGEWREVRLMPALLRIFTRVNLLAFFDEDQANRREVYNDVISFFWSCARAFPVLELTPDFLIPLVKNMAMGWGVTRRKIYDFLVYVTNQVLANRKSSEFKKPQANGHITQWIAEMTRLRDTAAIAKISLGLLFASAFQVPVIAQFCIYNICKHPQYLERLRLEASKYRGVAFGSLNQEMPYLDSFVKETARLSPGPIVSAPRKTMTSYTTPNGHHIPAGNWVAIPQASLMRDENIWPRASHFEGFRFVNEEKGTSESRFTHPSYEFPFWGAIQHAW